LVVIYELLYVNSMLVLRKMAMGNPTNRLQHNIEYEKFVRFASMAQSMMRTIE